MLNIRWHSLTGRIARDTLTIAKSAPLYVEISTRRASPKKSQPQPYPIEANDPTGGYNDVHQQRSGQEYEEQQRPPEGIKGMHLKKDP
jgi:hypothetical protein